MSEKPDVSEQFIDKLYGMSEGELKTFDRYEIGLQLGLDKEQTDALVEELRAKRRIQKLAGPVIILTPQEKEVLDNKKRITR
jgi:hypothetical protein